MSDVWHQLPNYNMTNGGTIVADRYYCRWKGGRVAYWLDLYLLKKYYTLTDLPPIGLWPKGRFQFSEYELIMVEHSIDNNQVYLQYFNDQERITVLTLDIQYPNIKFYPNNLVSIENNNTNLISIYWFDWSIKQFILLATISSNKDLMGIIIMRLQITDKYKYLRVFQKYDKYRRMSFDYLIIDHNQQLVEHRQFSNITVDYKIFSLDLIFNYTAKLSYDGAYMVVFGKTYGDPHYLVDLGAKKLLFEIEADTATIPYNCWSKDNILKYQLIERNKLVGFSSYNYTQMQFGPVITIDRVDNYILRSTSQYQTNSLFFVEKERKLYMVDYRHQRLLVLINDSLPRYLRSADQLHYVETEVPLVIVNNLVFCYGFYGYQQLPYFIDPDSREFYERVKYMLMANSLQKLPEEMIDNILRQI